MIKPEQWNLYEIGQNSVRELIANGWQTNVVTQEFRPPHKGVVIDGQCEVIVNCIDVMDLIELFIADGEHQAKPH